MRKQVLVLAAAGLLMAAVLGGCSGGGTDAAAGLSAGGEASSAGGETSPAGTETAAGAGTSSADGEMPPDDGDSDSSGEAAISEESGTATEALTGSLTVNGGQEIPLASLEHLTGSEDAPVVYFISDITPESLLEIYGALDWTPTGRVAVKMSTGEPPARTICGRS